MYIISAMEVSLIVGMHACGIMSRFVNVHIRLHGSSDHSKSEGTRTKQLHSVKNRKYDIINITYVK